MDFMVRFTLREAAVMRLRASSIDRQRVTEALH